MMRLLSENVYVLYSRLKMYTDTFQTILIYKATKKVGKSSMAVAVIGFSFPVMYQEILYPSERCGPNNCLFCYFTEERKHSPCRNSKDCTRRSWLGPA